MKRLLIPLAVAAGLLGPPAHASTTEERIVAELRDQGFSRVEIRRTLLGRTRIVATSPTYVREIVLNPSSGVILRDFWTVRGGQGGDGPSSLVGGPDLRDGDGRSVSGGSGRGSSGSGNDDDDDDSDDDDDDHNSGSGSSDDDDDDSGGGDSDDDDDDD